MKKISLYTFLLILLSSSLSFSENNIEKFKFSKSKNYQRITDCIIEDIDRDNIDEIIISYFSYPSKYIDVYKVVNNELKLTDTIKVPYYTVFFDVGDLDNNGTYDIVFLSSTGLFYREINTGKNKPPESLKQVNSVKSEIVVPQPELLTDVNMIIDLDGDNKNELIIENIRAIEVYETNNFTKLASIDLQTVLEYAMIPGQFYPHYIFYTLPIILIKDLNNDKKMEIITKFPSSIFIFSQKTLDNWQVSTKIYMGSDNIYFLSNSYVKFAFPVITDINNDKIQEIVIADANLNMPKLKFTAIGNVYYLKNNSFKVNNNKKILVKGIPLNLPYFFNITDNELKDFILPTIPFNLISIFGLLSGTGSIKVPFMHFIQEEENFDIKRPKKLFEISIKIENIPSFIEELPLDQVGSGEYPDFYYFAYSEDNKSVDIIYYNYDKSRTRYDSSVIKTIPIDRYDPELPSTLKLGSFSGNRKKDVVFYTHSNLHIIKR